MEPILDELAKTHQDKMIVRKVNVDKDPELTKQHKITVLGTTVFLKASGEEYLRKTGVVTKAEIIKTVEGMK